MNSEILPELTRFDDALAQLLQHAKVVDEGEELPLNNALGRVLATDIISEINVPQTHCSAMDGYAIRISDLNNASVTHLAISQKITAGEVGKPLLSGTAARIFTGAAIPAGADCVVLQENVRIENDKVIIGKADITKSNIRATGCHIKSQSTILNAGCQLGPQHIGLAASIGRATLPVFRRLKVALISTGDELIEPGQPLAAGKIYNANHYTLHNLLINLDCDVTDIDPIADDLALTRTRLSQAADQHDLIITIGGVSLGDKDYVKQAVSELGQIKLWRIRIKPGKPFAYGTIGNASVIGLPGNPVSSFVTFCLLARPFILKSQGRKNVLPTTLSVIVDFERSKTSTRREFMRVISHKHDDGQLYVSPCDSQDSATLMSTIEADGLLCIPENQSIEKGRRFEMIPLPQISH